MKPLVSKRWPVGHILNPRTEYQNAASTDIGRTMARAYAELERLKREQPHVVVKMKERSK